MRALILTPDRDQEGHDYSGAFAVEAGRCLKALSLPPGAWVRVNIAQDRAGRRAQVLDALEVAGAAGPLDLVAMLCHGWRSGVQLGFSLPHLPQLAAALSAQAPAHLAVVLWACSTGADGEGAAGTSGDGGFADVLRDCLSRCIAPDGQPVRGHIDAHDRAGHCTSNPYVRRMVCAEGGGAGGAYLVEPGGPLWRAWDQALSDRHKNTLRLRFPLLRQEEIAAELQGGDPC